MNSDIDFVIPWVDGNDPAWLEQRMQYIPGWQSDARAQRYREWIDLKFWFRGVEKFAPWVNRIHFVTWGHLPEWLNTKHPRLNIVKHSDYLPPEYLPTFNCNPLELNFHRIKDLSDKFVYFNDDTFIIAPTKKTDFFKNGKPRDSAALTLHTVDASVSFGYMDLQAIGITNKYFDMHKTILKNWRKWFNIKNGKYLFRTLYFFVCPRFPGIVQPHLPNAFLKSTYNTLWEKEGELFDETSRHKFRDKLDYTQWTLRDYQIASGNFENRSVRFGKAFYIEEGKSELEAVTAYIKSQSGCLICVNDGEMSSSTIEMCRNQINNALNSILPNKSQYEK